MILGIAFFSQTTVEFLLLGLATGALYAVFALGIVLTYRASGVLNFATGALGAIGAFLFYSLRDDHGFPWIVALVLALLLGAVIGALMQVALMSVLRKVSLLGKLISTLALISFSEGLIAVIWPSTGVASPNSILPTHAVVFTSQIVIPEDRLIIMGIVVVLTVVLRLVYSRTMFGLATSAVAESRRVAAASGWSPTRIELINFVVTGVLSAGAAILLAPIVGLDASVLTLVVLPALAAALVGRFSSFAVTVAAALTIGVISTELQLFQFSIANAFGWSQQALNGLPDVAPLLVIIIATMLAGRARLQRGEVLTRLPLPGDGRIPRVLLLGGAAIGMVLLFTLSPNWDSALTTTFAWGIVILSVVVVTGYGGQLSLCQYALAGFGAWVAARLVSTQGLPFELGLLVGVIACIPLGLLVALPALRTRGVALAVATLALALMIEEVIFDNGPLTGGFIGTVIKTPPHFFGINLDPIRHPDRYGAFALIAFVVAGLAVANVRRGRAGRRLIAVRANERAAASLGVGVYGAKLYAFGLSSAIAGLAGIIIGFQNPYVQFTNFDVFSSINVVLYSVLGGLGWAAGAVIGAIQAPGAAANTLITNLFNSSGGITNYLLIFAGLSTFLILWQSPDGLAALQSRQWRKLTGRFRRERPVVERTPEPLRGRPPATLEISNVTVRFGGVVALDDVSFGVRPGEIVGLIGPNGAGKTTLLDVVTGFTGQQLGSVALDGASIDKWSAEKRAREGLGRSWQAVELFEEMTVRENLLVGADRKAFGRYLVDILWPGRVASTQAMTDVVHEFELTDHLEERPSNLSQGTARLAGIARAIVTEPKVLLLDEPAAGLDSRESEELGVAIQSVVERTGIGVLVVEHDVNLLLNICDRIVVLDFGKKIAEGTPGQISSDPAVIAAYLGDMHEQAVEPTLAPPGIPL